MIDPIPPHHIDVLLKGRGLPAEWPTELPSDEAAFVFAMRIRDGESEYHRAARQQSARTAKACRRALAELKRCSFAFCAFPFPTEEDRYHAVLESLATVAGFCEQAARGRRGRPADAALRSLIRIKYREFRSEHPEGRGYWRDGADNAWHGAFLDGMEAVLARLGYPLQSRAALGSAIDRALNTA